MLVKAAICYAFGQPLVVEEIELDAPQQGEVQVKLTACAICHSDIHYMSGAWGGVLPAVYGHEAAGIVTDVGPGVSLVKHGDPVIVSLLRSCGHCYFCARGESHMCEASFALDSESRLRTHTGHAIHQGMRTGAFAESVVVHESQLMVVPEKIPLDRASLLACGVITGLGAVVNTAQVPSGSSVVIIGTGGVGLNSIQGAALAGAQPIIAVDLVQSKLEVARAFGATHTINSTEEHPAEAVHALTHGRGADYVFVTVGSGAAIEQGMTLLRKAGALVMVGMPASGVKLPIEAADLAGNGQRILGSKMGSTRLRIDIPKLVELYQHDRLKLDELITARYSLDQINEAIDSMKQGEALRNVIMF